MDEERLQILKMVESGQIQPEEAVMLLEAIEGSEARSESYAPSQAMPARQGLDQDRESRWARFWIYPMMAGGGVLILGALLLAWLYAGDVATGWLVCGWFPVLLGLVVVVLALWTRRTTWMHLRISEGGERKMAFSFPLPLGLAAWVVRIAQPFVPQLQQMGVDDLILALRASGSRGEPIWLDVQDDERGERVEVYMG
jgi:hypothetical protein